MDEFKNNEHIDAEDTQESAFQTSLEENTEEEIVVTEKKSVKKELLDWIISIVVALAIAFFLREYVFTIVRVDGPSMQPTLEDSDILFVNRFMYEPENGDIIIFHPITNSEIAYVKRVIAVEGQEVYIDPYDGTVYVDDVELKEDYIKAPIENVGGKTYPMVIPPDHVFVLGDNRNNSTDSRNLGPVSNESVMGKVIFRILPFDTFGSVYR